MPPSRRKGSKGKAKELLKIGDLVLAKVKGFPPWPAKISRPEDWDRSPDPRKYFVEFFGTGEIAFVAPPDIQAFTNESKSKLLARCQGKTVKYFVRAVEEICEAFDKLQRKSVGPEEATDEPAGKFVPSSVDGVEDDNHQNFHETPNFEDENEKPQKKDKSELSSDGPHGLEPCTQSGEETVSNISPGKRKTVTSNDTRMSEEGKSLVVKLAAGSDLVKEECSSSSNHNLNEKNGLDILSGTEVTETLMSGSTACGVEDLLNSGSLPNTVDGGVGTAENMSACLENAVVEPKVKAEIAIKVKKSHINKKVRKFSAEEEDMSGDEDGLTESAEISTKVENETNNAGKGSNNFKRSKQHASGKDALHGSNKGSKEDVSKRKVSEDQSSLLLGNKSLRNSKKQKLTDVEESNPAKRSKRAEEDEKKSKHRDASHVTGKVKGSKVASTKKSTASLLDETDMASNSEKQHDRKHVIAKDVTHPPSRSRTSGSDSAAISRNKALASLQRPRRRSFLIDDDDEEEAVHNTPVHQEPFNNLISANSNGHVAESCNDAAAAGLENASTENLHSKREGISSSNHTSPPTTDHSSPPPNLVETKDIKLEKELGGMPDYPKSSSKVDQPSITSPKAMMTEHKIAKSSSSVPTKKVQVSSSKQSFHVFAGLIHTHNQEAMVKNRPSSTQLQRKLDPKSETSTNTVMENRSDVNFSAEPNIEKDTLLWERLGAAKGDKSASSSTGSKFVDSDKSLKHLIVAAQERRKALSQPRDNTTPAVSTPPTINGKSPSPDSTVHPISSEVNFQKDAKVFHPSESFNSPSVVAWQVSSNQMNHEEYERRVSPAYKQFGGSLSGGTEASIARDALEGMLETLSRTKESIGRATRLAISCAKYGIASEVVELLIRKLEGEPSLHRRIDFFFLVDSITQISHSQKGIAGASYIPTVQSALPRLLGAAAPPGAGAHENRRQCLKVLKLWLERKILPESLLRRYMDDIAVPNEDVNTGFLLRRPSRAERSIDDPIREMEGMLVDEYGSNANFELPGLFSAHAFEDDDDLSNDLCRDNGLESASAPEGPYTCVTPSDRGHQVLKDVDGELEMQDVSASLKDENARLGNISFVSDWENKKSIKPLESKSNSLVESPPLPSDPPPPSPPLPLSPPPPPPPPFSSPSPPPPPPPPPPSLLPPALQPLVSVPDQSLPQPSPPNLSYIPPAHDYCIRQNDNQLSRMSGNAAFPTHGNAAVNNDLAFQQHANVVRSVNCNGQPIPGFTSMRPFEYGHNDMYPTPQDSNPNHQFQQGSGSFHHRPFQPLPPMQTPPSHPFSNVQVPENHYTYAKPMAQQNAQQSYNPYSMPSIPNGHRQYVSDEPRRLHPSDVSSDNHHGAWLAGGRGQSCSGSPYVQDGFSRSNMERTSSRSMPFQHPLHSPLPSRTSVPGRGYPHMFPSRPDGPSANCWRPG